MSFEQTTDLKSYENEKIKAEISWILSQVQIWTLMKKKEKRWGSAEIQIGIYIGM